MEQNGFELWQLLLLVLSVSAVASFGIVQLLKMLYVSYLASTPSNDHEPWYWNGMLRGFAIVVGTVVGAAFAYAGVNVVIASSVGLVGGVLNTTIVKLVRARIKNIKISSAQSTQEVEKQEE